MAFSKKTWKDRLAEYAGRRKITNVSTGSSQIVDVERSEGTVSEEGSAFSAANMNDLEQRIGDGFDDVNKNITTMQSNFQAGCSTIAAAITEMGVSTASNATPATMAANIKKIKTAPEYMDVEIVCNASSSSSTAGGINNISGTIFKSVSVLSGSGHVLNLDTSLVAAGYIELSTAAGKSYTLTSGKTYSFTVGHVGNNSNNQNSATLRFYFR